MMGAWLCPCRWLSGGWSPHSESNARNLVAHRDGGGSRIPNFVMLAQGIFRGDQRSRWCGATSFSALLLIRFGLLRRWPNARFSAGSKFGRWLEWEGGCRRYQKRRGGHLTMPPTHPPRASVVGSKRAIGFGRKITGNWDVEANAKKN